MTYRPAVGPSQRESFYEASHAGVVAFYTLARHSTHAEKSLKNVLKHVKTCCVETC
jgi:hypothetical protein